MTTFALNKTPAITLPKINVNSQTALRVLVASYFSGAAMGLVSGPDVAGALSAAMPESAANIIGNGALLMLSFHIRITIGRSCCRYFELNEPRLPE